MAVTVAIDEEWIVCRRGLTRQEAVRWSDLKAVLIETTDQGPFKNDLFWVLVGENGRCVVPQEALARISQTKRVHRGTDFEKVVLRKQLVSGPKESPDADRV